MSGNHYTRFLSIAALSLALAHLAAGDFATSAARAADDYVGQAAGFVADFAAEDGRLGPFRSLNDYHPWTPPADLAAWKKRARAFRTQILVSLGLWPMPERTSLEPVIHGRIDKNDYTIDKVYFQSLPGHYVTGNLYRPKGRSGRQPGVLCPHGHWANGRFYDAGAKGAKEQLDLKAESFPSGARFPLQARMVSLARMGCVVFHYDMVGYADSKPIAHSQGFTDVDAILRLQSFMGLQTWNSIRALDFLTGLPDVDPNRIGVTGASGGGTQTFILCAIDERPTVAFPAVMVSTAMQGGCVCENAPLLRVGSTNIEFVALFAPKPCAMSGADDWTIEIESKGLPDLQRHYALFDRPENVMAKTFRQFKHNYNQPSRELMYDWFNRHLRLGQKSSQERAFEPIDPKDLSVWGPGHPQPPGARNAADLRRYWTEASDRRMAALAPSNRTSHGRYQEIVGGALRAMVVDDFPESEDILVRSESRTNRGSYDEHRLILARRQPPHLYAAEAIPALAYVPASWNGRMTVWTHSSGHAAMTNKDGQPIRDVAELLANGTAVLAPDVFLTGELSLGGKGRQIDARYPGYTLCYNRSVLANRVHDVLTAIGCAKHHFGAKTVDLVGLGEAGSWAVLAAAIAGQQVRLAVVDWSNFTFASITNADDARLLPGALKYGDLAGLAAVRAPQRLLIRDGQSVPRPAMEALRRAYAAVDAENRLQLDVNNQSIDLLLAAKPTDGPAESSYTCPRPCRPRLRFLRRCR